MMLRPAAAAALSAVAAATIATLALTASTGPAAATADTRHGSAPVIVLDPGHSPTIHRIDPRTHLNVSDYANEPEMRNVYRVALLVRRELRHDGYRVVMTKKSLHDRVSLAKRAAIANHAHADLALSIHDQAGSNGGIGFHHGNNTVYYQSTGTYRTNVRGHRVHFRNRHVAALSRRYGHIFKHQRHRVENDHINLQGNVGYNLGSRGLAPGNIWMVQLLSKVPWIYNEVGGNSAGRSGLDRGDRHTYARALVASVEHCIPPPH